MTRINSNSCDQSVYRPDNRLQSDAPKTEAECPDKAPKLDRARLGRKKSSAGDVLATLRRSATKHQRARRGDDAGRAGILSTVLSFAEKGAMVSAEHALEASGHVLASTALLGASAGMLYLKGLHAGFKKIIEAHGKAQRSGIRDHAAAGMAKAMEIAVQNPKLSSDQVRARVATWARKQYDSNAASEKVAFGDRPADTRRRNERYEGMRNGMELGLRLTQNLDAKQRQELAEAAREQAPRKSIYEGFLALTKPATGADSIHGAR